MTDTVTRKEFEALKERVDVLAKAFLDDLEWRLNEDVAIGYGRVHGETLGEVRGVVEAADAGE